MKKLNKATITYIVLAILLLFTGFVIYKAVVPKPETVIVEEEDSMFDEEILEADPSIVVDVSTSKSRDNAVIISVEGLGGSIDNVEYELTYESEEIIQGVNSGSKPIDTAGKDSFEREVYLGTCSRNVCRPHPGVTEVSLIIIFTDTEGTRSQFSGDFEL